MEQWRGNALETVQDVVVALVDTDGVVREVDGELLPEVTWRSAAKPFQLEASLSLLPGLTFSPEELAIGASSHTAQPHHTALVSALLARCGCGEEHLYCGADWPSDSASMLAAVRAGERRALFNNCSGKHTFMAAASRHNGFPADYRDPEHPVQQRVRAVVEERTGHRERHVVDGCGLPCFVQPLVALGQGWARLARAVRTQDGVLGAIGAAMAAHPVLAGGDNRLDTRAMQHATRPLVAKIGAEGLICAAIPESDLGVVVKVRSGVDSARGIALYTALERWFPGLLPFAAIAPTTEVRNVVGAVVGSRRVDA